MPLYEYFCPPCSNRFEVLRPISQMDHPAVCPSGHTTNNRVLSLFAPQPRTNSMISMQLPQGSAGGCACGGACSCG